MNRPPFLPRAAGCRTIRALVAGAVIACAAGAAQANTASASTNAVIYFTLTDLAPDDGIAPSYTVINPDWRLNSIAIDSASDGRVVYEQNHGVEPLSASHLDGLDKADVSLTDDVFESRATISSSAYLTDQDGDAGFLTTSVSMSHMAYLSPHTSITFHIDYEQTAASDWRVLERTYSNINASFNSDYLQTFTSFVQGERSGSLVYTYDNFSDESYWSTVDIYAETSVSAMVPEPSTYAMLAAGLTLLAAQGYRRSRRRA